MSHYKARPLVVAIHLALALVTPIALAATAPNLLFVEEAAGGTLTGPDDQHLTLTGLRDYVTAYSDRPIRDKFISQNQQVIDIRPNY